LHPDFTAATCRDWRCWQGGAAANTGRARRLTMHPSGAKLGVEHAVKSMHEPRTTKLFVFTNHKRPSFILRWVHVCAPHVPIRQLVVPVSARASQRVGDGALKKAPVDYRVSWGHDCRVIVPLVDHHVGVLIVRN
jgi:hypothetical protein